MKNLAHGGGEAISGGSDSEHCLVIHPRLKFQSEAARDPQSLLDEAIGLARAIDLVVDEAEIVTLTKHRPATLIGGGNVDRIASFIQSRHDSEIAPSINIVIVDALLTPVQQRNLEGEWQCKVIDRTGLILEIFGARARTKEGRLQVELAALSYQRSRLVRSWTHLERQRGGAGFMGGPGETQIESDRRMLDQRVTKLKGELKDVTRTRHLHRKARKKVPYPVLAFVGYTNAGKSTLFNTLTKATVTARDQLFATLDPTMRGLKLPSGRSVILSDTVGFISDLPHELVIAFHATLEEVTEADMILHIRDISHPDTEAQKKDVMSVLAELGIDEESHDNIIEVHNKIDALTDEDRQIVLNRAPRASVPMQPVSALTGEGCGDLLALIDARLSVNDLMLNVTLPVTDGAALSWLYEHGEVLKRNDDDENIRLTVRIGDISFARFGLKFPDRDVTLTEAEASSK